MMEEPPPLSSSATDEWIFAEGELSTMVSTDAPMEQNIEPETNEDPSRGEATAGMQCIPDRALVASSLPDDMPPGAPPPEDLAPKKNINAITLLAGKTGHGKSSSSNSLLSSASRRRIVHFKE